MEPIKILTAAARRECPECYGSGKRYQQGTSAPVLVGGCPTCDGTGLMLPSLSKACPGMVLQDRKFSHELMMDLHGSCWSCQSAGRILNLDDPNALDMAAEKLGYQRSLSDRLSFGYWHTYRAGNTDAGLVMPAKPYGQYHTRLAARQAALAEVVKAV